MKMDSTANKLLTKSLTGLFLGILAGSGAYVSLLPQPSLAQIDDNEPALNLRPNARPRNNPLLPGSEPGDYEVKGEELQRCSLQANSDKKNCTSVISGYGQIVSFGTQLYTQGNLSSAESIFRQLTQSRPKEATPYYKLGVVLDRQGRIDEAISSYRKAIEINAKHALARNSLGVALARQGQIDDAIGEWRQALEINSEYADAWTNLGIAMLQQGKEADAVENFKKARELYLKQREFQKVKQVDELLQRINSQST
ncbi:tetratricopeptide repeat protein [Planktothrix sp. FACHB-1355]|uniref:Tetratricopeptide repeat protein n=1 Tax=Aerosakkonema funiforme FACHB-1375 TaxID=2949571 RepID=A0A926ZES8_9CYAN|nr:MULTISPECIES: tetratricopeptide repeat protein [Oscillatoriales]MBD2180095.1 tetratricopeptide repeat protein [Aerosakkonema funiforme FACHB-1375]MBD3558018.1 tetratricopeptide repeat protein [Planktothrix sp. FACHB-1355]